MIKITWLGHATFALQFESEKCWFWIPGLPATRLIRLVIKMDRVDAIAVSHGHFDHVNDVLQLAREFAPKIVAIFEVATFFEKKGAKNTIAMNKGGTVDLGFVKLTMTHALHSSAIKDGEELVYGGEAAGYVLGLKDGRNIYFAGDTTVFSDMALYAEIYTPEMAMLPIGDHFTMGPHEAAYAARMLKVKQVIPMHYATFPALTGTPAELATNLENDGILVKVLETGKPFEW